MPLFDKPGKGILSLFAKEAPAKEAVNLSRRGILGLPKQADALLPTVIKPPAAVTDVPPIIGALEKAVAEKMAKPTTRREFMEEGAKAAATTTLRRVAPGALKQAIKAPPIDEPAAANKIADYLSSVYNNEETAALAYKIANGADPADLSEEILTSAWGEFKYANDVNWQQAAKTLGLDPKTIATQTGLPFDVVKKLAGDGKNVLDELAEASELETNLKNIIYDGRGKEAARSTSYIDVISDETFLNDALKKAMQDLGPNADEYDIISEVGNNLRQRFNAFERGNTPTANASMLRGALRNRVLSDDLLSDVFHQADETYDSAETITEMLEAIRNPKPAAPPTPTPEVGVGRLPWHNDVMEYFDSFARNRPDVTDKNFIARQALDHSNVKTWYKDAEDYFDKVRTDNPNMPLPEQINIMQSQTGLPIEFLRGVLGFGSWME